MFGTFVNTSAIIFGSLIGILLKGRISKTWMDTIMQAIGLAILLVGLVSALKSSALLLIIISMAVGSLIGEIVKIEQWLENLGAWIERKTSGSGKGTVAKGFVTASLVFCVGSMAIVGSLESGLTGNHQTLFAKSILDGIASLIFASTFGIGVLFSAIPVLLYQSMITIAALWLQPFLTPDVVAQMSSVGGLLIIGIGINILEIKKIRVANMLPAIFIPLIWFIITGFAWF